MRDDVDEEEEEEGWDALRENNVWVGLLHSRASVLLVMSDG